MSSTSAASRTGLTQAGRWRSSYQLPEAGHVKNLTVLDLEMAARQRPRKRGDCSSSRAVASLFWAVTRWCLRPVAPISFNPHGDCVVYQF